MTYTIMRMCKISFLSSLRIFSLYFFEHISILLTLILKPHAQKIVYKIKHALKDHALLADESFELQMRPFYLCWVMDRM